MSWNQKYWDTLANIYWTRRYMGLESIPRKKWTTSQNHICIPKNEVPTNTGIYVRKRAEAEQMAYLRSQEETLNHVFDLTLAIAGDEVVRRLLFKPLGFDGNGPIESLGREVKVRYGWKGNVTQQDGFFVSPESIVGIELKLGSETTSEQVLKYVTLMHCEELITGARPNVGLLFIVPNTSRDSIWEQCSISASGEIDESYLDDVITRKLAKHMQKRIEENGEAYRGLLNRLNLGVISWSDFDESMSEIVSDLAPHRAGDQTLIKLLEGLQAQLRDHDGTGIEEHTIGQN